MLTASLRKLCVSKSVQIISTSENPFLKLNYTIKQAVDPNKAGKHDLGTSFHVAIGYHRDPVAELKLDTQVKALAGAGPLPCQREEATRCSQCTHFALRPRK